MDASILKALNDKIYDKRKSGALELEKLVRDCLHKKDHDRIARIVDQLCDDYAYAIHQPYARNGGLIGLAAASIALGPEVARYLEKIVPPVLACFTDQDARVRYYACESMYNISKTSKGEILPFFNEVFDALAKLAADSELSVENGAELLDRLIKDIISDSATSYVSILYEQEDDATEDAEEAQKRDAELPTAFSLARFIPLLQERIFVLNPYTRMFLVSWITLLDSIPDLELVAYLPSFLGGLFRFLNDTNQDVVTSTQHVLERFLDEIKMVAKVKKDVADARKASTDAPAHSSPASNAETTNENQDTSAVDDTFTSQEVSRYAETGSAVYSDAGSTAHDDWVPGQDVQIDYPQILDILINFLRDASEEHIQLTALRWIDSFFDICPEDILPSVPRLLNQVLPALSSDVEQVRQAGSRVNGSLMDYIISITDEEEHDEAQAQDKSSSPSASQQKDQLAAERRESGMAQRSKSVAADSSSAVATPPRLASPPPREQQPAESVTRHSYLEYEGCVNALTLQFLNENEATRIAALSWLIMLQRKAPKKVLAAHDGTFPALLKTLSDTSDTVVTRDLQLLSQISKHSDDSYFTFFMVNLLKLFCTDRRLLESRGNLIIRQLCNNLSPERIYRTMADCLEKDEDVEFASIMVQNLNNNLITAPELADLRKKLRNWDSRDGQTLFVALFRSWCHNAVATISLCLLGQAYEQAYNLLQIFADIEMSVNTLIQIDKLVQLLESPVFTFLRLQLLEPERFPFLYKTLYGILMLLPQSAAFAALKNRLNSVSAIGYLHVPGVRASQSSAPAVPAFDRTARLKSRDEGSGPVRWTELLEKFRTTQDRARRSVGGRARTSAEEEEAAATNVANVVNGVGGRKLLPPVELGAGAKGGRVTPESRGISGQGGTAVPVPAKDTSKGHKSKFSASNLGRLTGVKGRSK